MSSDILPYKGQDIMHCVTTLKDKLEGRENEKFHITLNQDKVKNSCFMDE
jgi:hypothetical protein